MTLINVPILCNNDRTHQMKLIGQDIDTSDYDVREGKLNIDLLFVYYPTADGKHVLAETHSTSVEICLTMEKFEQLISEAK